MSTSPLALTAAEQQQRNTGRLVMVITLLLIFIMAARIPLDSDLFWHLRAGEETLRTGRPVLADIFSYTRFGAAWINHSWLSQVILALLNRVGGPLGLGLLVAVVATASMGLAYTHMRGPALLRAFILVLAAAVAAPVWTPRPQLFSLLLFSLTAWWVDRYREKPDRRILWLLPLFVLWSNLHGGYPLGLLLIGATLAGEVFNRLFANAERNALLSWKDLGRLAGIGAAGFALTALNPNGYQMWLIPFKTLDVGLLQTFIQEWASPDFHDPVQQPFLVILLLSAAALGLSKKRADGVDVALLVLYGGLGLVARRNFGPFALVAAPVLSAALAGGIGKMALPVLSPTAAIRIASMWARLNQGNSVARPDVSPLKKAINLLLISLLGLIAAGKLYSVTQPVFVQAQIATHYPLHAVQWLRDNRPAGRIFNAYNWGGYLLWSLPEYPVFVDGRTDLYGDEILSQWVTVVQAGDGWQEILDRWQVSLVLLEPDRPLVRQLPQAGWKLILRETGYVLYGR